MVCLHLIWPLSVEVLMANKGLTEEEVFDVIGSLVAEKQEITVKAIRDQLGTGSFSTISKHLQQWKKLNQKNPIPEIPAAVLKVSQNFWNVAFREAEVKLQVQKEELKVEKIKWAKDIEYYKKENEKAEIGKHSLEARNLELFRELERVQKLEADKSTLLSKQSEQIGQLKAKFESMAERFAEEKARATKLEKELSDFLKKKNSVINQ